MPKYVVALVTVLLGACAGSTEPDPDTEPGPLVNRIAFVSTRVANEGDIFTVSLDGSDLRRLTPSLSVDRCPAVSPDGTRIAFSQHGRVMVMQSDGSNPAMVTSLGGVSCAAWSPDGSRLAFHRRAGSLADELWVVAAVGGEPVRLAMDSYVREFVWSPTRDEVVAVGGAYSGLLPTSLALYIVPADGGTRTRITTENAFAYSGFSWSPDGNTIAFGCDVSNGTDWNVCAVNRDGTNLRTLIGGAGNQRDPAWAPVGGVVALTCDSFLCLWSGSGAPTQVPVTQSTADITWDRSGQWIAFTTGVAGGRRNLTLVRANGTDRRNLSGSTGSDQTPSFGLVQ